jgi:putative hydrolase of the HAD superfamily
MSRFQACLLDAYGTILSCDFSAHRTELPALAGIGAGAMNAEFRRLEPAVTDGRLSLSDAYARIMRACGTEPGPGLVDSVADKSRELLLASARLYDDVLPFLRMLRSSRVKTAIVSNCDENTRDLLVELGVAALADALVLSCEVGAAKPAGTIFHQALDQLGVAAEAAVFVDDHPVYCAGAAALGVTAVQMVRGDSDGNVAWNGQMVRSLRDVEAMLSMASPL